MNRKRNTLLDWLRALAILMVVTVHTWSLSHIDSTAYPVLALCYKLFYRCGVPLFVMISGALQLPSSILPIGVFYKKRFTRILVPFLIWSIVIYTLSCIVGKYEDIHSWQDAIRNYIPFLLTNRINEAYWFMGLIIALYAITPFLQRAFQTCSKQTLIGIIVCWLIYIVAQRFYPELYLLQYSSRLTYFLGFYILGFLLRRGWGGGLRSTQRIQASARCQRLQFFDLLDTYAFHHPDIHRIGLYRQCSFLAMYCPPDKRECSRCSTLYDSGRGGQEIHTVLSLFRN